MSKKHKLSGLTSQQLQQQFMDVCMKLGQEIANEDRAVKNQAILRTRQHELEKAFLYAAEREQEAAQAKARDEKRKADAEAAKALKDAAAAAGTPGPVAPTQASPPPPNDAQGPAV